MTETFREANNELHSIADQIQMKAHELVSARENHLRAKAFYENEYARLLLEAKARFPDMVQEEIKAVAKRDSYEAKLEAIKAESSYRRIVEDIKALRDKLDAMRECSYNLRQESRV